jgi:F-type H+-transporting ATPase subunit c
MNFRLVLIVLALFLFATPIFAQTNTTGTGTTGFVLPAGIAMAIASGLCGLGQGRAVASALEAMARNPGASATIQTAMLLGLAFVESLALFTLVIVFLKG